MDPSADPFVEWCGDDRIEVSAVSFMDPNPNVLQGALGVSRGERHFSK